MTRPAMSTRQASRKTADAADQLLDWLGRQDGLADGHGDGQADLGQPAGGGAEAPSPDPPMLPAPADTARGFDEAPRPQQEVERSLTRRAERTDDAAQAAAPLRPRHTDWLHHRLLVVGPAGTLADFQAAARGAGTIPWRLDFDRMEEDLFLMLAAPPPPQRRRLSLVGARALAGQLRDAAERRHGAAVARVVCSPAETHRPPQTRANRCAVSPASRVRRVCGRACAFDLHALVPVPPEVLQLGPDHPEALAWLWTHWGTTAALRHVVAEPILPRRTAGGDHAMLRLAFWSADWTPWRALATVAARWPALRFDIRPTYGLL